MRYVNPLCCALPLLCWGVVSMSGCGASDEPTPPSGDQAVTQVPGPGGPVREPIDDRGGAGTSGAPDEAAPSPADPVGGTDDDAPPPTELDVGPYYPEWWSDVVYVSAGQLFASVMAEHDDLREANRLGGGVARDALAAALRDRGIPDADGRAAVYDIRATDAHRLEDGTWRVFLLAAVPLAEDAR
jgi:hypothetical protein